VWSKRMSSLSVNIGRTLERGVLPVPECLIVSVRDYESGAPTIPTS
jgi:hypothetical protein